MLPYIRFQAFGTTAVNPTPSPFRCTMLGRQTAEGSIFPAAPIYTVDPTLQKYSALNIRAKKLQPPGSTKQLALYTRDGRNKKRNCVSRQPHLRTLTASSRNNFETPLLLRTMSSSQTTYLRTWPPIVIRPISASAYPEGSKQNTHPAQLRYNACVHACSCLLYTSPSPRDRQKSRMPSSA